MANDPLEMARDLAALRQQVVALGQLVHRHLNWRESTVSHTLAELKDQGTIREKGGDGPGHYVIVAPPQS